jgi:hypothetical protein
MPTAAFMPTLRLADQPRCLDGSPVLLEPAAQALIVLE